MSKTMSVAMFGPLLLGALVSSSNALAAPTLGAATGTTTPAGRPGVQSQMQVPLVPQGPLTPQKPIAAKGAARERRLFSDSFEASSFLWNDWNKFQENYHANYAGDDDPKTAWVEGDKGSGAGQWLRMKLTALDSTTSVRVRIRNGYQKSPELFKQNARVKTATLTLMPSGVKKVIELKDDAAWQEFVMPQTEGALQAIEIKVAAVYEGSKYTDMCLSDVQVFATSTTVDNPAFEKSKKVKLMTWRAARVAAAKEFAKGKVSSVLGPAYDVVTTPNESNSEDGLAFNTSKPAFKEWAPALAIANQALAQFKGAAATGTPLVPAQLFKPSGAKHPQVDGFLTASLERSYYGDPGDGAYLPVVNAASIFFADRSKIAETKSKTTVEEALRASKCNGNKYWVMRSHDPENKSPDRVTALVVTECGMVETRGGKDLAVAAQILVYREDGKLLLVAGTAGGEGLSYASGYRWADRDGAPVIVAAASASSWAFTTVTAK